MNEEKKNITQLIEQYKNNFTKLERATKEERKAEEKERTTRDKQSENYYKLQDKKITSDQYLKEHEELKKEEEKAKEQKELLTIERKLLQDNENIMVDKILLDVYNNIIKKYENKNIGEATTTKIDGEIKKYLKELYNKKYIEVYSYNEFRNYLPNQFINLYTPDYSFSNYQKKLCFNLLSIYGSRNDYKQNIYIKDNQFLLNEYSKIEEKEKDNESNANRIEQTQIFENTKAKAKEIYKAYKKKMETLEKLRKQEEAAKRAFDDTIKTNQDQFLHHLYNYFYR